MVGNSFVKRLDSFLPQTSGKERKIAQQVSFQIAKDIVCTKVSTECVTDLDKLDLVKFDYGGLVLGSSQFSLLAQLSQKIMLDSKVVTSDSKIIISLN